MSSSDAAPWTGTSIRRVEDDGLLRGATRFTADIDDREAPDLEDAVHVAFVRSPFAHATILDIDRRTALETDEVIAVLTADDIAHLEPSPFAAPIEGVLHQPMLPQLRERGAVRFAGQVVAAVVATTAAAAADAAELVEVEFEPLDPVLDVGAAVQSGALVDSTHTVAGDPADQAKFDDAEVVVRQTLWSPRQVAASIEARSMAACWRADRTPSLTVWAATQRPHGLRDSLSVFLAVDQAEIRVIAPAVGGGFGGKTGRTAEEHLVPALAMLLERPVRWDESRQDYLATTPQCRGELIEMTMAGTAEGRITALRGLLTKDGGAYGLVGLLLPGGYTRPMANGAYDIDHVEFESRGVLTNLPPTSAYRGAGRSPWINAIERTIDRFAIEVGIDAAEVRRKNLIKPDQMPYRTPTEGLYDEADYPGDLERALEAARYSDLRRAQQARRSQPGSRQLGIGVASYNHMTTGGGGEEAHVTVGVDGRVTVVTGSTSQGHGHATTWAQIAGDVLGVDPLDIEVIEGDTAAIATGVGAVGSRSLQTAGVAVHHSASEVWDRAAELAAQMLEASVDDIVSTAGVGIHVAGTPGRALQWADVAAAGIDHGRELSCGEFYDTEGRNTFPSGCHVAVVEVDVETGRWTLDRLIAVDDAGPRVHPVIVEGQLHGGLASGAAHVLGEAMQWDELGNLLTSTFAEYTIPSADQLPSFETVASATPTSLNELGWKGVGESGTIGATPAVHNAVVDAVSHLGVRHIELPCTPERVWQAIEAARAGS